VGEWPSMGRGAPAWGQSDEEKRTKGFMAKYWVGDGHATIGLSIQNEPAVMTCANRRLAQVMLSRRQRECLLWIARGKTYDEIAVIEKISFSSIKNYLDNARHKLHAVNLPQAVAIAVATGVLKYDELHIEDKSVERIYPPRDIMIV
jgi:DNA-binding CsgD family transcriptional regulator